MSYASFREPSKKQSHNHTDTSKDGQIYREAYTDRHAGRQYMHTYTCTDIQTGRQADRQTGRQADFIWIGDRQADRQTGRQTNGQADGQASSRKHTKQNKTKQCTTNHQTNTN
jgi:hypothetical protein